MTTAELPADRVPEAAKPREGKEQASLAGRWARMESLLDRIGDRLNPILVKEARQSMKSRQFVVTFSLLLIGGWAWTLLFIAAGIPAIYYAPVGLGVLRGYFIVLSIPLLIVVPYAAFRSLAGEWEDGTFELLSITSLSARQIITGKLASAFLQMMVYYSALAPCIAFTYLLRGIDIVTIGLFLAYSFFASLLLSSLALMMATVTRVRHWQVLLSVVLVMALLIFTFFWNMFFMILMTEGMPMPLDEPDFWIAHLCGVSFYIPAVLLLLFIAAGQITFASENRSTPVRWLLLVPQALLVGWYVYFWHRVGHELVLYWLICMAAIYWLVAGAVLTGETAELSPRALRKLPQSFLGRMLFTWFNPGSATGYVFAVLNLTVVLLIAFAVPMLGPLPTNPLVGAGGMGRFRPLPALDDWMCTSAALLGYVAGYLGFTRLLLVAARRLTPVAMPASFLCHILALTFGILIPLFVQGAISGWDYSDFRYTSLQLTNWAWTMEEVLRYGAGGPGLVSALIIAPVSIVIFMINFILASHEVHYVRQAAPLRVAQDEAVLHPATPKKRNPWDEAAG